MACSCLRGSIAETVVGFGLCSLPYVGVMWLVAVGCSWWWRRDNFWALWLILLDCSLLNVIGLIGGELMARTWQELKAFKKLDRLKGVLDYDQIDPTFKITIDIPDGTRPQVLAHVLGWTPVVRQPAKQGFPIR